MLKKIEQEKKTLIDVGKINQRQFELMIDAVRDYASKQFKWYRENDSDIYLDNSNQLKDLESYLWEIVSDYKGWKKNGL
jgi:hypothetical protein